MFIKHKFIFKILKVKKEESFNNKLIKRFFNNFGIYTVMWFYYYKEKNSFTKNKRQSSGQ